MTMARSKPDPRFGKEAGTRFTVILRRVRGRPALRAAALMRSLASESEASGNPSRMNAGRVCPMSDSTSTM